MKCKIDGCEREAVYKKQCVCQKHYFRFMRYGTYDLSRKRKYRYTTSNGYQCVFEPDHPLSNASGYVYEHRKVVYGIVGENVPDCEICGKKLDWSPYYTHIDHINRDRSDNSPSNLRVLCNGCNTQRDIDISNIKGVTTLTIDGETRTIREWSAQDGANHTSVSIRRRLAKGFNPKDAVFGCNKTHKNKKQSEKLSVKKARLYEKKFRNAS